jgi:hypothetical protein
MGGGKAQGGEYPEANLVANVRGALRAVEERDRNELIVGPGIQTRCVT